MPPHHEEEEDKPCRACSDFKTWAKLQNKGSKTAPTKPVRLSCNSYENINQL